MGKGPGFVQKARDLLPTHRVADRHDRVRIKLLREACRDLKAASLRRENKLKQAKLDQGLDNRDD
jgi:hypothetical protein